MKRFLLPIVLMGVVVSGCSFLGGDSREPYLDARTIPAVDVPEGLDKETLGQVYKVPEENLIEQKTVFPLTPPPGLVAHSAVEKVSLQALGGKRWISVAQSTADTWPQVIRFLQLNQLPVNQTNVAESYLETAWLPLAIDPGVENQYRLKVEQGIQPGTTEIHVLQRHRAQGSNVAETWPGKSLDPVRESWMLNELAVGLAASQSAPGDSLLAHNIGGAQKVVIRQQQGEPVLTFSLDEQRAVASLSYALTQENFELYQQNLARKVFYVNLIEQKKKSKGWFSSLLRLAKWGGGAQQPDLNELLASLPAGDPAVKRLFPEANYNGKPLKDIPGYLVVIRTSEQLQQVYVRNGNGQLLDAADAQKLLSAIRQQLI